MAGITNDMVTAAIVGAIGALAVAYRFGYLRFPTSTQAPPPNPVYYQPPAIIGPPPATYKSVINIPHEVAITPQHDVK